MAGNSDFDPKDLLGFFLLPFTLLGLVLYGIYAVLKGIFDTPMSRERKMMELTQSLYQKAIADFSRNKDEFLESVGGRLKPVPSEVRRLCMQVAGEIWDMEDFDIPKPPPVAISIEGGRYRDSLSKLTDLKPILRTVEDLLYAHAVNLPEPEEGLQFPMYYRDVVSADTIQDFMIPFFDEGSPFPKVRAVLRENAFIMSGIDLKKYRGEGFVPPIEYEGKHPIWKYLDKTPMLDLFDIYTPMSIPIPVLFEHVHIMGATGSGKTQLLQWLIAQLAETDCSIVVMDSQGDMIQNLLNAEPLFNFERIVHISPVDVEFPLALNIFDIGQNSSETNRAAYERHMNSVVDLITYVLSSVLESGTTPKQSGLLKYLVRLMVYVPNATLLTLKEVLNTGDVTEYAPYIAKLSQSAQQFFNNEFSDTKTYKDTRTEIGWRLSALLENPTIERMFSSEKTKFRMNVAMNSGKVVLIDTAKEFLKKNGCSFFGRFFISLIAQAIAERATQSNRTPTFVIIDEAQEYLDSNIGEILAQARKYNVSLTTAHQDFEQIPTAIRNSILANTRTKIIGSISHSDARILAPEMRTNAEMLAKNNPLQFTLFSKGVTETATSIRVTGGIVENMPRREERELDMIRTFNREDYCYRIEESAEEGAIDESVEEESEGATVPPSSSTTKGTPKQDDFGEFAVDPEQPKPT